MFINGIMTEVSNYKCRVDTIDRVFAEIECGVQYGVNIGQRIEPLAAPMTVGEHQLLLGASTTNVEQSQVFLALAKHPFLTFRWRSWVKYLRP